MSSISLWASVRIVIFLGALSGVAFSARSLWADANCDRLTREISLYEGELSEAERRGDQRLIATITAALSAEITEYQRECVSEQPPPRPVSNVLTQHNDNQRTGSYLGEKILTTKSVHDGRFGHVFDLLVDGQIYAQPLYVASLAISNRGTFNVLFVATQHNIVYAFDADRGGAPLWQTTLGSPLPELGNRYASIDDVQAANGDPGHDRYAVIYPHAGVTSTPVIDLSTDTMYVVAALEGLRFESLVSLLARPSFTHMLLALDIHSGVVKRSTIIFGSVPGSGDEAIAGRIYFDSKNQVNRPGLLLLNNHIYVAFANFTEEFKRYHGWVFGYEAETLKSAGIINTSPGSTGAGIWQSGNGLTADESFIYFFTGNGGYIASDSNPDQRGSSVIKLSTASNALAEVDHFTPFNQRALDRCDLDLGSAGPVLLPQTRRLVGGGKEGRMYVFDADNLGTSDEKQDFVLQWFKATEDQHKNISDPQRRQLLPRNANCDQSRWIDVQMSFPHIHGSPVVWPIEIGETYLLYVWGEHDKLKAFRYEGGGFRDRSGRLLSGDAAEDQSVDNSVEATPDKTPNGTRKMPGGILSLSANDSLPGTGIVWASHYRGEDEFEPSNARDAVVNQHIPTGVLTAFDALNLKNVLWDSEWNPRTDSLGPQSFAKFVPPTIANGRVYMATSSGKVAVYGLR